MNQYFMRARSKVFIVDLCESKFLATTVERQFGIYLKPLLIISGMIFERRDTVKLRRMMSGVT